MFRQTFRNRITTSCFIFKIMLTVALSAQSSLQILGLFYLLDLDLPLLMRIRIRNTLKFASKDVLLSVLILHTEFNEDICQIRTRDRCLVIWHCFHQAA